ncbi:MAG: insulinase family protein [Candidatus Omnitrophica bacterium]|nr:insulinase family protein [Candidatus Omnitrophota bacterium]
MDWDIFRISNDIPVIYKEKTDGFSTALAVWIKIGSRYEPSAINGISHFTEHILFKGTKTRTAQDIKESIEGKGGSFNAFTSEELTCYYIKILEQYLDTAFDVLSDMVKNPLLASQDIKNERNVIIEEIKMYYDTPARFVHDLFDQTIFENHPLGCLISGTEQTVSAITKEYISGFIKKYYSNKNIVISACGKFDKEKIKTMAEKYFSSVGGMEKTNFIPFEGKDCGPKVNIKIQKTEQAHFCLGCRTYQKEDERNFILTVLNVILGGNMSSRLFNEVREKRGLAYEIRSYAKSYYDTGSFVISAGLALPKLSECMEIICDEFKKILNEKISEEEITRAKEFIVSHVLMGLEDNLEYSMWLGEQMATKKKLHTIKEIEEKIRAVSAEDVLKISSEFLRKENLYFAMISSEDKKDEVMNILERF